MDHTPAHHAPATVSGLGVSDPYDIEALLPDPDRALLADLRTFIREDVAPIINCRSAGTSTERREALV